MPPLFFKLSVMIVCTSDTVQALACGSAHSCSALTIQPSQLSVPAKGTPKSTGIRPYFPTIAVDYLEARTYPGPIMNAMLVYMGEEQAGGEDAAIEFLMQHEDLWSSWVSADAAAKIKAGL